MEFDVDVCGGFLAIISKNKGVLPRLVPGRSFEVESEVIAVDLEVIFSRRDFDAVLVEDLGGELATTRYSVQDYKQ